jgi:preprotein translocase subunit SecE
LSKKQQLKTISPKKSRFSFFKDFFDEMKKVTWPSRRETVRLTLMVIAVCAVVGLILGAIDYGFGELVAKVFLGGGG